jgi:4-hydroxythreonine-4-phosphate dehydrogenase
MTALVAVTMGDPAGVGPEVVVKALCRQDVRDLLRAVVIGDAARLTDAARRCGLDVELRVITADDVAELTDLPAGIIAVIDVGGTPADLPYGEVSAAGGEVAYQCIRIAAELALSDRVDAICTAPLNKEALHAAGHRYPGHTELLADLTGTPEVSMLLIAPDLRVVHVTTHIGIIDAIERIDAGLVARTIRRANATLVRAGIARPRIAVCGINPHAGENGLFGHGEEASKIDPAIAEVVAEGIDAVGPLPADTLFFRARRGDFDCVVAMYHDQGHGPVKVLGLEAGVNVTIGLPVVRTSVDHGTAFDIAGTGVADERSMVEALRQAVTLATAR